MKRIVSLVATIAMAVLGYAANKITTVDQVTSAVTISTDVDYVIRNKEPFTTTGSVDITNTEHATVIIKYIKPSVVKSTWLKTHVFINGEQAVDGKNCQVKMYACGAIIMPYASTIKPLTVYSEQNYGGTAVNSFGLENSGGYMNTLTEAKLNNKIRSFKLKRGYMVTFSTRASGRGYSRCFIADKQDLEMATLPAVLDGTISSYRVFQWYDAQKKGVGSDTRAQYVGQVGGSWCYDWGTGHNMLPDIECVPNHIYEDWPSSSACGSVTYSCHMKTNNEPGNSADDHPQTVEEVLANWENLMRTGLRLCSESSHDGSMNHLKTFIEEIDKRGWRCDILDLHCYWDGEFNNLDWYISNYGNNRPVWISEWVWGSSWGNKGAFNVSNRGDFYGNQDRTYNGTKPILDKLNSHARIERYAYWNSEADCSKIYRDAELSKLGEYYRDMETTIGYNKAYEYVPKNPPVNAPANLNAEFDNATGKVKLTWHDDNGEYNRNTMTVQTRKNSSSTWTTMDVEIIQKEDAADYELTVDGAEGYQYRVAIKDLSNITRNSNVATASSESVKYGDQMLIEGNTLYVGGNQLINGDFELGTTDWTNGKGDALTAPYFQVLPEGGIDGGAYLQCYGAAATGSDANDKVHAQAVRKIIDVVPGAGYYVSAAGINNNPTYQRISSSTDGTVESVRHIEFPAVTKWGRQSAIFMATDAQPKLTILLRRLAGKAQFDNFVVCQCFPTKEEALADALAWEKKRAEAFVQFNTWYNDINTEIQSLAASADNALELKAAIDQAIQDIKDRKVADARAAVMTAEEKAMPEGLESIVINTAIQSPNFDVATGWSTKTGTYKDGDQRLATQEGRTCWNAWWSISATGNQDKTMAIEQELTANGKAKFEPGLYAVECKATTQHLCETDQHAFIKNGEDIAVSPALTKGVLDLPNFTEDDNWQTLTTSYLYVPSGGSFTIGFEGSKKGAMDKQWIRYGEPTNTGDNREGWWCATDFKLRYVPMLKVNTDSKGWGIVCLPRSIVPQEGMKFYQLAGILKDNTAICLEEVEETVGGTPYVFHAAPNSTICFYQQGTAATSARTNVNGLRGNFVPNSGSKYAANSLAIENGEWVVYTNGNQPLLPSYSGQIQAVRNLTKIDAPKGVMLYTKGLATLPQGDANGDGVVDIADAELVAKYYLGIVDASAINYGLADMNRDGIITMSDANAIVNMIKK